MLRVLGKHKMSKQWLAAALLPWAAFAQNSSDTTDITIYNRVKQPAATVLAPVEVITKAEIERRQPKSVTELLRVLPGVQMGSSGGLGQQTSLFIRGTNSDQSLVLINGRPLASMVAGSPDLSQIPVASIERVEYIRGPRAVAYGANAIGGVINIITTTDADIAKLSLTGGSHDYVGTDLSLNQWVSEQTRVQLGTGYQRTRGYDIQPGNDEPDRDGFHSRYARLGLEHELSREWSLFLGANGWDNQTRYDGAWGDISENQSYQLDGGVQYQHEGWLSRLDASYGESELRSWKESQGRETSEPLSTAIHKLSWLNQLRTTERSILTAGVDWQNERIKSESRSFGNAFSAPDRDNLGLFASAYWQLAPFSFELAGRTDDNEQFGRHNTWQATTALELPASHRTTLSYGTAFRAPSFAQLYWPGFEAPDLQPEEAENWELGFAGQYELGGWKLNLYRNEISNLIQYQGPNMPHDNTDALIKGVELQLNADTGIVHHVVSFDYTDAEDKRNDNRQLLRRAKRKASWRGELDWLDAKWSLEALYVGKRNDQDFSSWPARDLVLPSYTLWNLAASYPLTSQLTLNGKVNNLFDKDYQNIFGYRAPGAEFYLGADYRF